MREEMESCLGLSSSRWGIACPDRANPDGQDQAHELGASTITAILVQVKNLARGSLAPLSKLSIFGECGWLCAYPAPPKRRSAIHAGIEGRKSDPRSIASRVRCVQRAARHL